ncbi:LRR 8 domain containing protein [Asbolus verrucosus]|uniref:LRR 8 domain containing protein n=1 Tax=Asbolus verrucosus TaxID=1661398 RepID=A0A482W9J4_ASBVE|nr:LRR 8 domain containing protein [Asbolus verrucosus]
MTWQLFSVIVILTIFFVNGVVGVTFKDVTVWNEDTNEVIVNIKSSETLKDHLPHGLLRAVSITGKIPILHENSVADINNVNHLNFIQNEIEEIRPGAFRNLNGVHIIHILLSNFTTIKEGVFANLTIEELQISNKLVSKIEVGAFKDLPQLRNLNLQHNSLETLDGNVFDGLNIDTLDLSHNLISKLPQNIFRNLPHLKMLALANNQLKLVQTDVLDHLPVEYLDLSSNLISTLDEGVFNNMPQLKSIVLSRNKLTTVPEGVFNNLDLTLVKLDSNKIAFIAPKAFDNMPKLANIYLSSNELSKYDTNWFHNTPEIYRLYLAYNLIEDIPDEAFKNIYNDKEQWIRLDSNKIRNIAPNAFKGLRKLDTLNLSYNKIEVWNENILADAEVVFYLQLAHNDIKCVDGDFDKIFEANFTYLTGNPLTPQCAKDIEAWASKERPEKHVVCLAHCNLY